MDLTYIYLASSSLPNMILSKPHLKYNFYSKISIGMIGASYLTFISSAVGSFVTSILLSRYVLVLTFLIMFSARINSFSAVTNFRFW